MITYDDLKSKLERPHEYGRYFTALCPFHEDRDTPSLMVFRDGWFQCLSASCSRRGTWKTLWNKVQGQPVVVRPEYRTLFHATPDRVNEYVNAEGMPDLETLCYQAHMDIEQFPSFQWYMEMRGLEDSIEIAEIGYYRGWYTFPVWDKEHKFVTAVFRSAPHIQETTHVRYYCPHAPVPYVPDWALLRKPKFVVVVFGILDALTVNRYRLPVMTSTAGTTTFKAEWLDEYRCPVYILPDKNSDEAPARRLANQLGWRGNVISLDYPKGCKDCNDFLTHGKEKELIAQLTRLDTR